MRKRLVQSSPLPAGSPRYTPLSEAELRTAGLPGDAPPRPLNKIELSEWLGTTTRFLENEVRAGRLRAIRLGRRSIRFLPGDVSIWLNARPSLKTDEVGA